jgi:hypothetical protein
MAAAAAAMRGLPRRQAEMGPSRAVVVGWREGRGEGGAILVSAGNWPPKHKLYSSSIFASFLAVHAMRRAGHSIVCVGSAAGSSVAVAMGEVCGQGRIGK